MSLSSSISLSPRQLVHLLPLRQSRQTSNLGFATTTLRAHHQRRSLRAFPFPSSSIRQFSSTTTAKMSSSSSAPPAAEPSNHAPNLPEASSSQTGVTASSLSAKLRQHPTLQASVADVQDISGGCGQSFAAVIVSGAFEGKGSLARHRLVNAALREEVAAIHAWTPKCFTEKEWAVKGGKVG